MIFELAQDVRGAVAAMPRGHPRHRMLELLEEAIRRDIHFIARHPTTLFQCMWNTCWWYGSLKEDEGNDATERVPAKSASSLALCSEFRGFLQKWCSCRRGTAHWLQANSPLPGHGVNLRKVAHFVNPSPIQAFCPHRRLLAVALPTGTAEMYTVPPGTSLFSRHLNGGRIAALTMSPDTGVLAVRYDNGVISVEGYSAMLRGRLGESAFALRSNSSLVAVNQQDVLVSWSPATGLCEQLATNVPFPLRVLRHSARGNGIFFVAGANRQRMGIVAEAEGESQMRIIDHLGPEIVDADIDFSGRHVVLLLKNRSIRVTDFSMTTPVAEMFYQRAHPELSGAPLRGVLSGDTFYFVTSYGRIGRWNWNASTLDHVGNCFEKTEHHPIAVFDLLSDDTKLLISLPTHALALDATELHETTVKHDGRPTQCILSSDRDVFITASEDESVIRWFSPGLAPLGAHPWPRPTCIAYIEITGEVVAGNRSGFVLYLPLSGTGGRVQERRISSRPIVGVVPRGTRGCVAIDAAGECFTLAAHGPTCGLPNPKVFSTTPLKAFSAPPSEDMWSLCEAGNTWTVAHVDRDNQEAVVVHSRDRIWDAAVSPNGQILCIAGGGLSLYERHQWIWRELAGTRDLARLTAFVGNEFVALVLRDRESQVEIRSIQTGLASVAVIELGHRVACMGATGPLLALGLESGHLVSMLFRTPSGGDW